MSGPLASLGGGGGCTCTQCTPSGYGPDIYDIKNYRPITLLPTCDKVFEKLLSDQVIAFMDQRLSNSLTAYRKKHSTETTLINIVEQWKHAIDNRNMVGVLSTDMSKAFDSLHPPLLLNKLKAYGFSDRSIKLIRSYFTNRQYRVKMDEGCTSEWKEMGRGCPQGSTFGPLLWNIFQNDLTYDMNKSKLSMYADDHQIYAAGRTIEDVQDILNNEGRVISEWYDSNLLQGNFTKYQTMSMGTKTKNKNMTISMANKNVTRNSEMKLLGLTIDENLDFRIHIAEVCKKVARKVGVLMRLRNMLPIRCKMTIYKTVILPQLTYCHTVWNFCRASDSRKLERLQERALRAIFNKKTQKSCTYEDLLAMAKIPTLKNRRLQDIAKIMYKVKHRMCPNTLQDIFTKNTKSYNLRNSEFFIPRFNTVTYGKHSLRYLGPLIWSKLDKTLRNAETFESFKKQIRSLDLDSKINANCKNCLLCSC